MNHSMKQLIESGIAGAFLVPGTGEEERDCTAALKALDALLTHRNTLLASNDAKERKISSLQSELGLRIDMERQAKELLKELTGRDWQICEGCGRFIPATWSIPFCDDGTHGDAACLSCLDRSIKEG